MTQPKKNQTSIHRIKRIYLTYRFTIDEGTKKDKTTLSFRSEESLQEHIRKYEIRDEDIAYLGQKCPNNLQSMSKYDLERMIGEFNKHFGEFVETV